MILELSACVPCDQWMNWDCLYVVETCVEKTAATEKEEGGGDGEAAHTLLDRVAGEATTDTTSLEDRLVAGGQAVEQERDQGQVTRGGVEQDVDEGSGAVDTVIGEVDHVMPESAPTTAAEGMEVC